MTDQIYPTQSDVAETGKLERVVKDIYSRIYKSTATPQPAKVFKQVDIHTGKLITAKKAAG